MDLEILIADLSGRFDAHRRAELDDEADDLAHAERATVTLASRLAGATGTVVSVVLRGGEIVSGRLIEAAVTWILLKEELGSSLVPIDAVVAAHPLGGAEGAMDRIGRKLGIGRVLRELADAGEVVVIDHDAGRHRGRIVATYRDHVDLTVISDGSGARDPLRGVEVALNLRAIRRVSVRAPAW